MRYADGGEVRLGDTVRLQNGLLGRIVISVDTGEYADDFPASDWTSLAEGVLVEADNGALVAIDTDDDQDVHRA